VLARDPLRRVEEREADACGHLEQRALLRLGGAAEPLVERRQLLLRRKPARLGAQLGERAPELGELERRYVDQAGRPAGTALEDSEQVVDGADLYVLSEQLGAFQLVDERIQVRP
jgi:hypothetical protein